MRKKKERKEKEEKFSLKIMFYLKGLMKTEIVLKICILLLTKQTKKNEGEKKENFFWKQNN